MTYEIAQTTTKQPVAVEASMDLVVPLAPQLPAVVSAPAAPNALRYNQRFNDIIEIRGKDPKPTRFFHRFFNVTPSWGIVGGAIAAALTLPLVALGAADIGLFFIVSGASAGIPAAVGGMFYGEFATPFNALTRGKHLKEKDLAFLSGLEEASATEQAVIGLLAQRWMKRIDRQFVNGEAAFARIEDLATNGKNMPAEAQATAVAIVALQDAMVDDDGRERTKLDSREVRRLINAFNALPALEKRACAPDLMQRYFNGEVARVTLDKHEDARALYRALRDGLKAAD